MTKITTFDRTSCKVIQDAIVRSLREVEERFGVSITAAGGTMDGAEFKAKFQIKVVDPAAVEADQRRKFSMACFLYSLKPEHYGATVPLSGGRSGKLIGVEPGRSKRPIKILSEDGKVYVSTEASVKHLASPPGRNLV
jgi:hypothetical protein